MKPKGLIGLVVKTGIVKSESQARVVLVIFAVACFLLAVFNFGGESSGERYGNYRQVSEQYSDLFQ